MEEVRGQLLDKLKFHYAWGMRRVIFTIKIHVTKRSKKRHISTGRQEIRSGQKPSSSKKGKVRLGQTLKRPARIFKRGQARSLSAGKKIQLRLGHGGWWMNKAKTSAEGCVMQAAGRSIWWPVALWWRKVALFLRPLWMAYLRWGDKVMFRATVTSHIQTL